MGDLTEKQRKYAWLRANGLGSKEAYLKVYDAKSTNPITLQNGAAKVERHPDVKAEIERIRMQVNERLLKDAEGIRRHVTFNLLKESVDDGNRGSERIRALELLGKMDFVKMFTDKVEHEGKDRSPTEIEEEIRRRLREMLSDRTDKLTLIDR